MTLLHVGIMLHCERALLVFVLFMPFLLPCYFCRNFRFFLVESFVSCVLWYLQCTVLAGMDIVVRIVTGLEGCGVYLRAATIRGKFSALT